MLAWPSCAHCWATAGGHGYAVACGSERRWIGRSGAGDVLTLGSRGLTCSTREDVHRRASSSVRGRLHSWNHAVAFHLRFGGPVSFFMQASPVVAGDLGSCSGFDCCVKLVPLVFSMPSFFGSSLWLQDARFLIMPHSGKSSGFEAVGRMDMWSVCAQGLKFVAGKVLASTSQSSLRVFSIFVDPLVHGLLRNSAAPTLSQNCNTRALRGKGIGKWSSGRSRQVLRCGSHLDGTSGILGNPRSTAFFGRVVKSEHGFNQSGSDEHANHHLIATRSSDPVAVVVVVRAQVPWLAMPLVAVSVSTATFAICTGFIFM